MNVSELQAKLLRAAAAARPEDRVPYAFERRITALIRDRLAEQRRNPWVRGLWRAAFSCVGIAFLCGVWVMVSPARPGGSPEDLSQTLETTLLASVDQPDAAP